MAKVFCSAGFALFGWAMPAEAVVVLNDAFNYINGPLITVSVGKWVHHSPSGSATGQVQVVAGRVFLNHSEAEDVHALLPGGPYFSGSSIQLYAAFNVSFSSLPDGAASSYFAHFKDNSTGFRARIFTTTNGAPTGMLRIGVGNAGSSPTAVLTNNLSLGSNYTVVVRYVVSNASTTIWLDPATELSPSVTATDSASALSISGFALRQPSSINDGIGYGHLYLDDLAVGTAFIDVVGSPANSPPVITGQPQNQTVVGGANVTFAVQVTGSLPLHYHWQFNSTNLDGATRSTLTLTNVTPAHAGEYTVTITNQFGSINSQPATLTVNPPATPGFSLLTYNVGGNGATDWSTNSPQVQAIARQLQFLNPDIITFQEIPFDLSYEMTNFVNVFLPGHALARNSGTDGSIRSVIASRFPITRSTSWLDSIDLRGFGYSNVNNSLDNFTRDLFEAEIGVPGFAQPLHVFTTHLKATSGTTYTDAAAKRAAEAAAITNFLATNLLALYSNPPYVLAGDMNESDTNAQAIQYLISPGTGLELTNPTHPSTGSANTFSSRASLSSRLDYIFPGGLLRLNIASSQVFRTDLLINPLPPLQTSDSATASDHLPVLMRFNHPYDKPFRLSSILHTNQTISLTWTAVPGQSYEVEASSDLMEWNSVASNLLAAESTYTLTIETIGSPQFFRVQRVP